MEKTYRALKTLADFTDRVVEKIMIFLMIAMFITVLAQIFHRYIIVQFIRFSFPYTDELARYLTVWIAYLGIAVGLKEGIHASFNLIFSKLSSKSQRLLYIIERILMLYFIIVIIIFGWIFLGRIYSNVSPAMQIPMVWAYSAPWIGSWLILFRLLVQLLGAIFGFDKPKTNIKDFRSF